MPLILRQVKGSKLTIPEMDGNLTYLENTAIAPLTDTDAINFVNTTNYSLSMLKTAMNNLVLNLKEANLWNKIDVIYPFRSDGINNTREFQIKFNLKDPQDSDTANRLTFAGGITYTAGGIMFNGINGYANTHYKPSDGNQNSFHMSIYSLTNSNVTVNDIGSTDNPLTSGTAMLIRDASNNFSSRTNQFTSNSVSNQTSLGLYCTNRTASNVVNLWRNTTKVVNATTASTTPNSFDTYIGRKACQAVLLVYFLPVNMHLLQ